MVGTRPASQPAFSADGKYLFFVSDRDFNPIYSRTEWNHAYQDLSRIYFVTLAKETPSPFKPKSDEVLIASVTPKSEPAKAEATSNEPKKDEVKKEEPKKELVLKVDIDSNAAAKRLARTLARSFVDRDTGLNFAKARFCQAVKLRQRVLQEIT